MRSHISTASSMLCVTIRIDLIGMRAFVPEVEQVGAQRLRGQHVERRERLVHQQDFRLHDERAGEADALAHAAGKLLRIGGFRSRRGRWCRSPCSARLRVSIAWTPIARGPISTLSSTVSQGNSAKLWNTIATPSAGPVDRLAVERRRLPSVGRVRPEMMPQQRRLAAAGAAEQRDDLAGAQRQRDVLQHRRALLARALGESSG